MKSFRLYKPVPVQRFVTDYTVEERNRLKEEFRPIAEKYNHRMRLGIWVIATILVFGIFVFLLPKWLQGWLVGGFFCCWFILMYLATVRCECSGCHNDLAHGFGHYCPECGERSLQPGRWLSPPWCTSCCKRMSQGKGRRYKVRACTHCGLFLHDQGL